MSDWAPRKLRALIGDPISGSRPAGGVDSQSEGVPSLGGENILFGGGVTFTELKRVPRAFYDSMPRGHLQPFDVLINKDGAQTGKVGIYTGGFDEACVNEHLFILRNLDGAVDQRFLYYSLLLPETQLAIARRITGSAQPGLNSGFVDAVEIGLPPGSGLQRRIAEILSAVDKAIEGTERLIAKHQQIKAGLMHDLFTRGLTPDGRLRPPYSECPSLYKDSPLGPIPKEWEIELLEKVASYQHGRPFPSTDYSTEGVLLLRPGNLHVSGLVQWDETHTARIPDRWLKECPEFVISKGDILMNLTAQSLEEGFLGRVCLVVDDEKSLLNQRIARFTARSVEPLFLYWVLKSRCFRDQIERTAQGTKVQHIYNRDLDRAILPVPSQQAERLVMSSALWACTEALIRCRTSLCSFEQTKRGLMHDLLTGEVRVSIPEADDNG